MVLFGCSVLLAAWRIADRWPELRRDFLGAGWSVSPALLAASAPLLCAGLLLTCSGWILAARDLGSRSGTKRLAAAWFASQVGRYVPGKIWLFAGRIGFLRSEGMSMARAAAASAWEVMTSFASVGLVALPLVLLGGAIPGGGVATAVAAASAALLLLPLTVPAQRLAFRVKGIGEYSGVRASTIARILLLYSASWILRGAATLLWLEGLGLDTRGFAAAAAAAPLSWLAGYIVVFVPGGIGIREAATAAICVEGGLVAPATVAVLGQTLLMALFELAMALAGAGRLAPRRGGSAD